MAKAVSRQMNGRNSSPGASSTRTTARQMPAAATTAGQTHRHGSVAAVAADT
jgi:hypothetical protein